MNTTTSDVPRIRYSSRDVFPIPYYIIYALTDFGISFKSCTWIEEDETPWINWLRIRTSRCSSDQLEKLCLPTYVTHQCIRPLLYSSLKLYLPFQFCSVVGLRDHMHNDTLNTRVQRRSPRTQTTRTEPPAHDQPKGLHPPATVVALSPAPSRFFFFNIPLETGDPETPIRLLSEFCRWTDDYLHCYSRLHEYTHF